LLEFKVPELGENVAGGDVTSILVKVGDTIAVDQPVLELETDKATVEVPSSVAGRVTDIKVKPGDKVNVGAVVLIVENGASDAKSQSPNLKPQGDQADTPAPEDKEPAAPVAGGLQASGQKDKVVSMPSRQAAESKAAPRADAAEAQATPKSQTPTPKSQIPTPKSQTPTPKASRPAAGYAAAPAAPSVRRLAREVGVNIDEVQGSGPDGRISEEDVKEHARRILSSMPSHRAAAAAPAGGIANAIDSGRISSISPAKIVSAVFQPKESISATPIGE
jgi:pyruvate dehydrogenase E2 component (dihydrolipoamide acetyltransferase)